MQGEQDTEHLPREGPGPAASSGPGRGVPAPPGAMGTDVPLEPWGLLNGAGAETSMAPLPLGGSDTLKGFP